MNDVAFTLRIGALLHRAPEPERIRNPELEACAAELASHEQLTRALPAIAAAVPVERSLHGAGCAFTPAGQRVLTDSRSGV